MKPNDRTLYRCAVPGGATVDVVIVRRSKRTGGLTVRIINGEGVYAPGVDLHVKPHELHRVGAFEAIATGEP